MRGWLSLRSYLGPGPPPWQRPTRSGLTFSVQSGTNCFTLRESSLNAPTTWSVVGGIDLSNASTGRRWERQNSFSKKAERAGP